MDPSAERTGGLLTRVASGGVWIAVGEAARMGATLVSTPFVIRLLGPLAYGAWTVLQMIFRYLRFGDAGMAATSTRFAASAHARGDDRGEASATWNAIAITGVVQVVLAGSVAISANQIATLFSIPTSLHGSGVLAIRFTCIAVVLRTIAETFDSQLAVRMRWRAYTLLSAGPTVAGVLAVPVVLSVDTSLAAPAGVVAVAAGAGAIATLVAAVRALPTLRRPRLERELLRPMIEQGAGSSGADVLWLVLNSAERLFVVWYVGLVAVGRYTVAASIAAIVLLLPAAAHQLLLPAFVRLDVQGSADEMRQLYTRCVRWLTLLMVPAVVVVGILVEPFLRTWAGPGYATSCTTPCLILLGGTLFEAVARVPRAYLVACGRAPVIAWIRAVELGPYLGLAAVMTWRFGLVGAAWVWSIQSIIESFVLAAAARRISGRHLPLLADAGRLCALVGVALVTMTVVATTVGPTWTSRTVAAAVALMGCAVVLWYRYADADEQRAIAVRASSWARRVARARSRT